MNIEGTDNKTGMCVQHSLATSKATDLCSMVSVDQMEIHFALRELGGVVGKQLFLGSRIVNEVIHNFFVVNLEGKMS